MDESGGTSRSSFVYVAGYMIYGSVFATWIASAVLAASGHRQVGDLLLGLVAGAGLAWAIKGVASVRSHQQLDRLGARMPKTLVADDNEDGSTTVMITRNNGDVTTLVAPSDYHPAQDGGMWIFEQILTKKELIHLVKMKKAVSFE